MKAMKDNWISVKDVKPRRNKWVLLATKHWVGVGKYSPDTDYPDALWQDETTEFIPAEVTHWMERPMNPNRTRNPL